MLYSFVVVVIAIASVAGAYGLLKEALQQQQ